jgi:hypothetical protein
MFHGQASTFCAASLEYRKDRAGIWPVLCLLVSIHRQQDDIWPVLPILLALSPGEVHDNRLAGNFLSRLRAGRHAACRPRQQRRYNTSKTANNLGSTSTAIPLAQALDGDSRGDDVARAGEKSDARAYRCIKGAQCGQVEIAKHIVRMTVDAVSKQALGLLTRLRLHPIDVAKGESKAKLN